MKQLKNYVHAFVELKKYSREICASIINKKKYCIKFNVIIEVNFYKYFCGLKCYAKKNILTTYNSDVYRVFLVAKL